MFKITAMIATLVTYAKASTEITKYSWEEGALIERRFTFVPGSHRTTSESELTTPDRFDPKCYMELNADVREFVQNQDPKTIQEALGLAAFHFWSKRRLEGRAFS